MCFSVELHDQLQLVVLRVILIRLVMHTPYTHMLQMALAKIVRCMLTTRPIKVK